MSITFTIVSILAAVSILVLFVSELTAYMNIGACFLSYHFSFFPFPFRACLLIVNICGRGPPTSTAKRVPLTYFGPHFRTSRSFVCRYQDQRPNEVCLLLLLDLHQPLASYNPQDVQSPQKLCRINFNMTFAHIPCDLLSLDAMDVSGSQQVDVSHHIFKKSIDRSVLSFVFVFLASICF